MQDRILRAMVTESATGSSSFKHQSHALQSWPSYVSPKYSTSVRCLQRVAPAYRSMSRNTALALSFHSPFDSSICRQRTKSAPE